MTVGSDRICGCTRIFSSLLHSKSVAVRSAQHVCLRPCDRNGSDASCTQVLHQSLLCSRMSLTFSMSLFVSVSVSGVSLQNTSPTDLRILTEISGCRGPPGYQTAAVNGFRFGSVSEEGEAVQGQWVQDGSQRQGNGEAVLSMTADEVRRDGEITIFGSCLPARCFFECSSVCVCYIVKV